MLNPADYVTAALPTGAAVRDYVNRSNAMPDVYAELLDPLTLTPKTSLPDGTNQISQYIIDCTIENNTANDVPRSCTLTLDGRVGPYINFERDRVRLSVVYLDYDRSHRVQPVPKGIFGFQQTAIQHFENGEMYYTVTGYDDVWDLSLVDFLADYVIPRGYDVCLCAQTIMMMDLFCPSEGGRQPSGSRVGGPLGAPAYALTGVLASSVCSLNPTTGYLDSPNGPLGVISYNPYDTKVRCDATTYAPISPLTATPMTLSARASATSLDVFYDPDLDLYFRTPTGEFVAEISAGSYQVVDPFKRPFAPYPTGSFVKQPNPLGGGGQFGYYTPPCSTWPYDWDNSGPYYTLPTGAQVTVLPGNTATGPGLVSLRQGQLAARDGIGQTLVLPAGTYLIGTKDPSTSDPHSPGDPWIKPLPPGGSLTGPTVDASHWSFNAENWTVTALISGGEHPVGTVSLACEVYRGTTHIGTLASDGPQTFSPAVQGSVTVTATGAMPALALGANETLRFDLLLTTTDLTTTIAPPTTPQGTTPSGNGMSGFAANCSVAFNTHPIVAGGGSFFDPGNPGLVSNTTCSATGMPWPDGNNPGMAPSGCETPGCNFPASRIAFPLGAGTTLATTTFGRNTKHLAGINALFDQANLYHLWMDEVTGVFHTKAKPYYTTAGTPTIDWTFSNEANPPDGQIVSLKQGIVDQSAIWNIVFEVSLGQGTGTGIWAKRTNDDPASIVSRRSLLRPITHVAQNDNIIKQDEIDALADGDLQTGTSGQEALTLTVPLNPFFQTYDAINVRWYDAAHDTYLVDGSVYPYVVTYWKMTLKAQGNPVGLLDLTATRTVLFQ